MKNQTPIRTEIPKTPGVAAAEPRAVLVELPASRSRILYCSIKCAEEDGAEMGMAKRITRSDYEAAREEFGPLCPVCGIGYTAFWF